MVASYTPVARMLSGSRSSLGRYEQAGRRPALVISPEAYNSKVGLALVRPIIKQVKGSPFEVAIPPGFGVEGVILADQLKSLDWRACRAEYLGQVPPEVLDEVVGKLKTLIVVGP